MERARVSIFSLIFFLFAAPVFGFYTIIPHCDGECVSGQNVTWQVALTNAAQEPAEFTEIQLRDSLSGDVIMLLDVPYYPLRDDRGDLIVVKTGEEKTINISGVLPKPNAPGELRYYPCFKRAVPQNEDRIYRQSGIYETEHCYTRNETLPLLECTSSDHCGAEDYCRANVCRPLQCGSCQYIDNHACVDYQCCADTHCAPDQVCEENACETLECQPAEINVTDPKLSNATTNVTITQLVPQYVFNHTCALEPCAEGQILVNHSCVLADCGPEEAIINYTCAPLDCAPDQIASEHTCVPLDCAPDQGYVNHTCVPLDCAYDEHILDHRCVALSCLFFQKAEESECRLNSTLLIEALLVLVILFLVALDVRRYQGRYRKRLVSALLLQRKLKPPKKPE